MNLREYTIFTKTTAIYPSHKALDYLVLGLLSEAGEVAGKHKKYIRGDFKAHQHRQGVIDELGDVFWYMCRICDEMNIDATEVLRRNVEKLQKRSLAGKLHGDGDER